MYLTQLIAIHHVIILVREIMQIQSKSVNFPKLSFIATLFIIILMIANISINVLYSDPLYELGLNLIHQMQRYRNGYFTAIFSFFTLLADPVVVMMGICLLVICKKDKLQAFNSLIFLTVNTYMMTILKAYYAGPRPYWSHHKILIIGYYCPREYGEPSGHSWFVPILAFTLILQNSLKRRNIWLMVLSLVLVVMIPLSRMYLGAHSLNQILQGLLLGLCMVLLYQHAGLKQKINQFLRLPNQSIKRQFTLIIFVMHALSLHAFYSNNVNAHPPHQMNIWQKNIYNKCGERKIDSQHLNLMMLLLNTVLVNCIAAFVVGFATMSKNQHTIAFMSGKWKISTHHYGVSLSYCLFMIAGLGTLLVGFLLSSPVLWWLGINDWSKLLWANMGMLISGYTFGKYLINILMWMRVYEIDSEIKMFEKKQ